MKKYILGVIASVLLLGAISCGKREALTIKGSDTVLPLAQKLAEVYMQKNPSASITVVGGGSGVGIAGLIDGTTDIANASRLIKKKEIAQAKENGTTPVMHVIAQDALAVVVHPDNKVSELTLKQLGRIYTGEVTNWKEVGGQDMEIVLYSRESSSGTHVYFKEAVLLDKEYSPKANLMPATGAIVQAVSQTQGAVGYIGMAYLNDRVKTLNLARVEGAPYVTPTLESAMDLTYALSRGLYQYTNGNPEKGMIKAWFDFAFSAEGQNIVKEIGYVPVK